MKYLIIIIAVFLCVMLIGCVNKSNVSVLDVQEDNVDVQSQIVPVNDELVYDFAINNITISSIDWQVGEKVTVYPLVRNLGNSVNGLEVKILANTKTLKSYKLDMNQGEVKQLVYAWYPTQAGEVVLKVVLDPAKEFEDIHLENNQINYTFNVVSQ